MHHGHKLMWLAGGLGVGLFFAMFFFVPKPGELQIPYFLQVYLPQAADKAIADVPAPAEPKITMTFVGDIMLARAVERSIVANGTDWPFAELGNLFADSDLVIGNLEGTVRPTRNLEVVNQMVFDTTPDNITMLAETGFTHLSLANNHTDDYGPQVTLETRQSVAENDMTPFGDPLSGGSFIARENLNGLSVSLIGFHAFGEDTENILAAITSEAEQGRFVIVYPHWGVEYATTAPGVETTAAKHFVQAGADLIIGAHPHVIQNIEIIDGVPVIYSLGNFLFDQDFSAETRQGLTVKVTLTPENIQLDFTPVSIVNRQTFPMEQVAADKLLADLDLINGSLSVPRQ
ncbi:MAG: CapA family protein [Patescibacteria group bacterium]